jgi:hypothetical protein
MIRTQVPVQAADQHSAVSILTRMRSAPPPIAISTSVFLVCCRVRHKQSCSYGKSTSLCVSDAFRGSDVSLGNGSDPTAVSSAEETFTAAGAE